MDISKQKGRFFDEGDTPKEHQRWGVHRWYSREDITGSDDLMVTRVDMPAGEGHTFHTHPNMDEVIYVISGRAEQWLEKEKRILSAGDGIYVPKGVVHATFNAGDEPLVFLAILGPSDSSEQGMVDVSGEQPWKDMRS